MPLVRSLLLLLVVGLAGCPGACSQEMEHGGAGGDSDAGADGDGDASPASPCYDAGVPDASPFDASPYDGGPVDASPYDASPYDGGPLDAGDPCGDGRHDAGPDAGR